MSDDLVKRLRDRGVCSLAHNSCRNDVVCEQAADRIEELEATNARLETEAKIQAEEIDKTRRRAAKWQSMVLDCEEYLKFGETPAERIEREINDCLALMKLLETKQVRIEELEAKMAEAVLDVGVSLSAAISLLEKGGKTAAPSNNMFDQMLTDYRNSLQRARTTLAELKGET